MLRLFTYDQLTSSHYVGCRKMGHEELGILYIEYLCGLKRLILCLLLGRYDAVVLSLVSGLSGAERKVTALFGSVLSFLFVYKYMIKIL